MDDSLTFERLEESKSELKYSESESVEKRLFDSNRTSELEFSKE